LAPHRRVIVGTPNRDPELGYNNPLSERHHQDGDSSHVGTHIHSVYMLTHSDHPAHSASAICVLDSIPCHVEAEREFASHIDTHWKKHGILMKTFNAASLSPTPWSHVGSIPSRRNGSSYLRWIRRPAAKTRSGSIRLLWSQIRSGNRIGVFGQATTNQDSQIFLTGISRGSLFRCGLPNHELEGMPDGIFAAFSVICAETQEIPLRQKRKDVSPSCPACKTDMGRLSSERGRGLAVERHGCTFCHGFCTVLASQFACP